MSQPHRDQAEGLVDDKTVQTKEFGALIVSSVIFEFVFGWITVFNAIINGIVDTVDWVSIQLFGGDPLRALELGIPVTRDGLLVEVFRVPANSISWAWNSALGFFPAAGPLDVVLGVAFVAVFYLLVEYLFKVIVLVVSD